ncbi:MAG: hypothetical protein QOE71_1783 [Pseudonocardiales bacterium]|jgi:hypothetical protein|nr:hypothetical protein [Pseudonocardiales bacterium]
MRGMGLRASADVTICERAVVGTSYLHISELADGGAGA